MDDIARVPKPDFTQLDRFGLLDRLVQYRKCDLADQHSFAQKQLTLTPFDVGSCRHFNILASRGAFSGPHRDSLGATWVQALFGTKIWWILPYSTTSSHDLDAFEEHGPSQDPQGRARALLIEKGDILLMPHEHPVIHAVLALQTALMDGGMFWDEVSLEPLLQFLIWAADNQNTTNEPLAVQLPSVIAALERMINLDLGIELNDREKVLALIKRFQELRCSCKKKDYH